MRRFEGEAGGGKRWVSLFERIVKPRKPTVIVSIIFISFCSRLAFVSLRAWNWRKFTWMLVNLHFSDLLDNSFKKKEELWFIICREMIRFDERNTFNSIFSISIKMIVPRIISALNAFLLGCQRWNILCNFKFNYRIGINSVFWNSVFIMQKLR